MHRLVGERSHARTSPHSAAAWRLCDESTVDRRRVIRNRCDVVGATWNYRLRDATQQTNQPLNPPPHLTSPQLTSLRLKLQPTLQHRRLICSCLRVPCRCSNGSRECQHEQAVSSGHVMEAPSTAQGRRAQQQWSSRANGSSAVSLRYQHLGALSLSCMQVHCCNESAANERVQQLRCHCTIAGQHRKASVLINSTQDHNHMLSCPCDPRVAIYKAPFQHMPASPALLLRRSDLSRRRHGGCLRCVVDDHALSGSGRRCGGVVDLNVDGLRGLLRLLRRRLLVLHRLRCEHDRLRLRGRLHDEDRLLSGGDRNLNDVRLAGEHRRDGGCRHGGRLRDERGGASRHGEE